MEIKAPAISFGSIFSLNIMIEIGIMSTGDTDVMDETMPVAVY